MIARGLYRLLARDEYNSFKVVRDLEGVREVVEVKVEVVVNSGKSVVVVDVVVVVVGVVVVIKLAFLIVVYSSPEIQKGCVMIADTKFPDCLKILLDNTFFIF